MFIVTWHALLEEGNTWVELEETGNLDDSYNLLFWLKWEGLDESGWFFDNKVAACVNSYTYGHVGFKGLGLIFVCC